MHHNVGGIDQILRIVLGVVISTIGVIYNNWWGLVGLIPLVTGTISWCPLYRAVAKVVFQESQRKPLEIQEHAEKC